MSALAELFVRRGYRVSGCDTNLTSADDLRRLNIELFTGHDPAHVAGASEVIVTSAVRKDHPELVRARELGIPVTGLCNLLSRLIKMLEPERQTCRLNAAEVALEITSPIVKVRAASQHENSRFEERRLQVILRQRQYLPNARLLNGLRHVFRNGNILR